MSAPLQIIDLKCLKPKVTIPRELVNIINITLSTFLAMSNRATSPPKRPASPTAASSPSVPKTAKRTDTLPSLSAQAAPFSPSSTPFAGVAEGSSAQTAREVKNLPSSRSNRNGTGPTTNTPVALPQDSPDGKLSNGELPKMIVVLSKVRGILDCSNSTWVERTKVSKQSISTCSPFLPSLPCDAP